MAKVTLRLDQGAVGRVVGGQSREAARRAAERAKTQAQQNISAAGRVDTGQMRDRMAVTEAPRSSELTPSFRVGTDVPYARYQEEGSRGSQAAPGRVLRFMPKGSSMFIFRPRTKGFPGAHFMRNALSSIRVKDFLP